MSVKIEGWKPPGSGEVEFAAVVALYRQGLAAKTPPEERTAVTARAQLVEVMGVPKTGALIARSPGGAVEGLLILRSEPPGARIIFIAARETRKGTGSALIASLREIAAKKGAADLRIAIPEADARLRAFTKKVGFRETAASTPGEVEARLELKA